MPIFEYVCEQCDHEFEALVYGSEKPECPKCHSKKLTAQLSVFAVAAKGASSSTSVNPVGGCGTCGDPRGRGRAPSRTPTRSAKYLLWNELRA